MQGVILPKAGVTDLLRRSGSCNQVDFSSHSSAPRRHYQLVSLGETSLPTLPYRIRAKRFGKWSNSQSPPKAVFQSLHMLFLWLELLMLRCPFLWKLPDLPTPSNHPSTQGMSTYLPEQCPRLRGITQKLLVWLQC